MASTRSVTGRGMPGAASKRLKLIRVAAGFTQWSLAVEIERVAPALKIDLAAERESLKRQVSRWENGAPMNADYRRIYCHIFGMTEADLGFTDDPTELDHAAPTAPLDDIEAWDLADALTRSSISPAVLGEMERAVYDFAARYPASPPALLLPSVRRQIDRVKLALAQPQPLDVRRRCVTLLGVLSGIGGNLSLDVGKPAQADGLFNVGRLAGLEAEDADLGAWVTATASIGPFFAGRYAQAAELLAQAEALAARQSTARRRAWIASLHARALASAGHGTAARAALDRAWAYIAAVDAPPFGTDFFDAPRLDGIAGTSYLLLRDSAGAAELLAASLVRRAPGDAKGRALLTLDLAACHVIDNEPEEATRLAGVALDIAADAMVRPIVERANAIRVDMARWAGTPAVAELDARLSAAS